MTDAQINTNSAHASGAVVDQGGNAPVTAGLPNPVQWSEGMLLSPQHFQQSDAYWQAQMAYRLSLLSTPAYGISAIEFDTTSLSTGLVKILRLEAILPDGTPVVYPGSFTQALTVQVTTAQLPEGERLRIQLVLPAHSASSVRNDGSLRRFDAVLGAMAVDENTGVGSVPVDRLQPRLSLVAANILGAQYVALPLMELTRNPVTRQIEISDYLPPLLRWQAARKFKADGTAHQVERLQHDMWSALRRMCGNQSEDGPVWASGQGQADQRAMQARHLASAIPLLYQKLQQPDATPYEVYEAMVHAAASLVFIGRNPIPVLPDAYQHLDAAPQFRRLLQFMRRKLSYVKVEFDFLLFDRKAHRFTCKLPAAQHRWIVELRLENGRTPTTTESASLERWLNEAIIASASMLEPARRMRLGAKSRRLSQQDIESARLPGHGCYVEIISSLVEMGEQAPQALVQPGKLLVIDGDADSRHLQPHQLLLFIAHTDTDSGASPQVLPLE